MAMTGAERQRAYRERARERGAALDALPPIPVAARDQVCGIITAALVQARQIRDQQDRSRVILFWRELARSQDLRLERDRLAATLDRRLREREGAGAEPFAS
jgi:hypothetical protein